MSLHFSFHPLFNEKIYPLIDSRKITQVAQAVFFALKGERRNGHDFVHEVYAKGVRKFVIEKEWSFLSNQYKDADFYVVDNVLFALQMWAQKHREKFNIPVIGITGSNGKTIVKEWLFSLLETDYQVVKSPKSYNSQIGVPLSVAQINDSHELGIFEAGISRVGEMENLFRVIQPTIGILTNIGTAHDEGFTDKSQKLREKCLLFQKCQKIVYPADDELIRAYFEGVKSSNPSIELISWGTSDKAVLRYQIQEVLPNKQLLSLYYQQHTFQVAVPFGDKASLENCLSCMAGLLALGYSGERFEKKISLLQTRSNHLGMRLELKKGTKNCLLIDDSYNNDLAGLTVALDFLVQQDDLRPRTIILSEMLEAKHHDENLYTQIFSLLKSKNIKRLIGVGQELFKYSSIFQGIKTEFFQNTDTLINALQNKQLYFEDEIILIKGARKFAFERIVSFLEQKVHGTRLEINLDALTHNLNFYKSLLKPQTKMMVMVKAFGYGSGSMEVARLLQYHLVDYLGVAYTDEGVILRENGIRLPIMVMNPSAETFSKLVEYKLEPEIYSFRQLEAFLDFIKEQNFQDDLLPYSVHLNIDTGMARLGFIKKDIPKLLEILHQNRSFVKLASIYSHLAAADESIHEEFTKKQIADFESISNEIINKFTLPNHYQPLRHILNSPGITRFPNAQFDMVRLGIGLYGIEVNDFYQSSLKVVSTLKTNISQIKYLQKGETVGYGRKGIAQFEITKIGTIAIGYADGFSRAFSRGVGKVWVNGKLAPVIGNVCMDMTMIDLTGIDVQEGDEIVIFGEQLPIQKLADSIHTIPYEILTNVSDRVKRVFYSE
ncbi:MAG: bifunctional UDP-N-acetylmuramoyl-tripeptide:D-alanyl-D-alanine ligase/alanine racemase [Flammeovirgaceae bacterium]